MNGIAVLMAWVSFASLLTSILLVSGSNFDFLTAEGMFFYGLGDSGSLLFPRNAVVVGFLSSISYFFSLLYSSIFVFDFNVLSLHTVIL